MTFTGRIPRVLQEHWESAASGAPQLPPKPCICSTTEAPPAKPQVQLWAATLASYDEFHPYHSDLKPMLEESCSRDASWGWLMQTLASRTARLPSPLPPSPASISDCGDSSPQACAATRSECCFSDAADSVYEHARLLRDFVGPESPMLVVNAAGEEVLEEWDDDLPALEEEEDWDEWAHPPGLIDDVEDEVAVLSAAAAAAAAAAANTVAAGVGLAGYGAAAGAAAGPHAAGGSSTAAAGDSSTAAEAYPGGASGSGAAAGAWAGVGGLFGLGHATSAQLLAAVSAAAAPALYPSAPINSHEPTTLDVLHCRPLLPLLAAQGLRLRMWPFCMEPPSHFCMEPPSHHTQLPTASDMPWITSMCVGAVDAPLMRSPAMVAAEHTTAQDPSAPQDMAAGALQLRLPPAAAPLGGCWHSPAAWRLQRCRGPDFASSRPAAVGLQLLARYEHLASLGPRWMDEVVLWKEFGGVVDDVVGACMQDRASAWWLLRVDKLCMPHSTRSMLGSSLDELPAATPASEMLTDVSIMPWMLDPDAMQAAGLKARASSSCMCRRRVGSRVVGYSRVLAVKPRDSSNSSSSSRRRRTMQLAAVASQELAVAVLMLHTCINVVQLPVCCG